MVINLKLNTLERRLKADLVGWDKEVNVEYEIDHNIQQIIDLCKKHGKSDTFNDEVRGKISEVIYFYENLLTRIERLKINSLLYSKEVLTDLYNKLTETHNAIFSESIKTLEKTLHKTYKEINKIIKGKHSGGSHFFSGNKNKKVEVSELLTIENLKKQLGKAHLLIKEENIKNLNKVLLTIGYLINKLDDIENSLSEIELADIKKIRHYQELFYHLDMKKYAELFTNLQSKFSYWKKQTEDQESGAKKMVESLDSEIKTRIKKEFRNTPNDVSLYSFIIKNFGIKKFKRVLYPGSGMDGNRLMTSLPSTSKVIGVDPMGTILSGQFRLIRKTIPKGFKVINENSFDMIFLDNNGELSQNSEKIIPELVRICVNNGYIITPGPKYKGYWLPISSDVWYKQYKVSLGIEPLFVSKDQRFVAYQVTRKLKRDFMLRKDRKAA